MAKKSRISNETESVNFFVPMVDLMVSIVFVFIIIVMVLIMLIKATPESDTSSESPDAAAAMGQDTPTKPSVVEDVVANQTAQEILFNDVVRELLKQGGTNVDPDIGNKKIEIKVLSPKKIKNTTTDKK